MPRQARLEIPGVPMHVTQRGVNRCAIFIDDQDRRHYLCLLRQACIGFEVSVHAYVLMGNHTHLLLSAAERGRVSRAVGVCGQQHATHFNRRHGRTGTLWQERFWSCLVDSHAYTMQVMRYIELNPVRAGLAKSPESYRWTSAHHHLGLARDPLLSTLPAFEAFGAEGRDRHSAYRRWLEAGIPAHELDQIRRYSRQQRALGSTGFQEMVARTSGRNSTIRRPGRPNVGSGA